MARKSRRAQNDTAVSTAVTANIQTKKKENLLRTAAYGRLSVENETDESLQTCPCCISLLTSMRTYSLRTAILITVIRERILLGLDSDTFYIYHVAAVMVDNLRRLLLGINLSDKAIMDFDFPGVGFPV